MDSTINPVAKYNIHPDFLPIIPEDLKIVTHLTREVKWGPQSVKIIPLPAEWSNSDEYFAIDILGNCFSASVLNVLLQSPHLIPEEWKNKSILFMDTVYSKNDIGRYVLSLNYTHERGGWFWKKRTCFLFLFKRIKELILENNINVN